MQYFVYLTNFLSPITKIPIDSVGERVYINVHILLKLLIKYKEKYIEPFLFRIFECLFFCDPFLL